MDFKDFKPDNQDLNSGEDTLQNSGSEISGSTYHEEINTLKIDKLSNRVTIISIIIPCLISAVLIFAYLDMKERVVDVDITKQSQVEKISKKLDETLNALDVKIAKNRYLLDNKLPELDKKTISLEGQVAKIVSTKADAKIIKDQFAKLEKRVTNNTSQNKAATKKNLSTIKASQNQFDKATKQIKNDINLFKEEFDARLLELSDYEQQVGELRKSVSLLDKKQKRVEQDSISQITLDEKIDRLKTDFNNQIKKLDKQISKLNQKLTGNNPGPEKNPGQLQKSSSSNKVPTTTKPQPQINIDSSGSVNIKEESLTE